MRHTHKADRRKAEASRRKARLLIRELKERTFGVRYTRKTNKTGVTVWG